MKASRYVIGGAVVLCGVMALAMVNPATSDVFPPCLFHKYTGLYCPGCGTTRALHELLHGHFAAALRLNLLTLLLFPTLGILALTGRPSTWRPGVVWTLVVAVIAFGVLRNLPWYPFTLLAP